MEGYYSNLNESVTDNDDLSSTSNYSNYSNSSLNVEAGSIMETNLSKLNSISRDNKIRIINEVNIKNSRTVGFIKRQTVKQSQYNYNQILNLADKTLTGVGAETIAKLGGGFAAIPFTTDEATNLNLLGHAIALETGQLAARAGLGTNQGRDLALEQVSKTNWTKEAIKSSARTNRALTTGADLYGLGMENAIKASGNNPLAGRDYTSKWSSVADVNALKYYDAILNKDKQEIKTLVDSVGGPDSKGYKELVNKYQQIYQLVTKGQ
jgi:hypothetical protein